MISAVFNCLVNDYYGNYSHLEDFQADPVYLASIYYSNFFCFPGSMNSRNARVIADQENHSIDSNSSDNSVDEKLVKSTFHSSPATAEVVCLRNLIVNYVPPQMRQEQLKAYFDEIGPVDSCKIVKDKMTGQSLCYAFVLYKQEKHAMEAVQRLNGAMIMNKKIKVSLARPSCPEIKDANLYISGIPKQFGVTELDKLFSKCGEIITTRILTDANTGSSRGVGFIRFHLKEEAEAAVKQFDGYRFNGSRDTINVKFANCPTNYSQKNNQFQQPCIAQSPRIIPTQYPVAVPPPPEKFLHFYSFPSPDLQNVIAYPMAQPDVQLAMPQTCLGSLMPPCPSNIACSACFCLFVYNIASDVQEGELWQLFGPYGAVQSVKIARDAKGKCKGFAFVNMVHYEEAMSCISALNGFPYNNRILQVSFKTPGKKQLGCF